MNKYIKNEELYKSMKEAEKIFYKDFNDNIKDDINYFINSFNSYFKDQVKEKGISKSTLLCNQIDVYEKLEDEFDFSLNENFAEDGLSNFYSFEKYDGSCIFYTSEEYVGGGEYEYFKNCIPIECLYNDKLWKSYIERFLKEISFFESETKKMNEKMEIEKRKALYESLKKEFE